LFAIKFKKNILNENLYKLNFPVSLSDGTGRTVGGI